MGDVEESKRSETVGIYTSFIQERLVRRDHYVSSDDFASFRFALRQVTKCNEGVPAWSKIHVGVCMATRNCSVCLFRRGEKVIDNCAEEAKKLTSILRRIKELDDY